MESLSTAKFKQESFKYIMLKYSFRESKNGRCKGISRSLYFFLVYSGGHTVVLRAHERITSIK